MKKLKRIAIVVAIIMAVVLIGVINQSKAYTVEIDPKGVISFPFSIMNNEGTVTISSSEVNYKLYYQSVKISDADYEKLTKINSDTDTEIKRLNEELKGIKAEYENAKTAYEEKIEEYNKLAKDENVEQSALETAKKAYEEASEVYKEKRNEYNEKVDEINEKISESKESIKQLTPSFDDNKWIESTDRRFKIDTADFSGKKSVVVWIKLVSSDNTISYDQAIYTVSGSKPETVNVTAISLDKTEITVKEGSNYTLTATITPTNATDKTIEWSSSNEDIAKVENGRITAVARGTATITAKTRDGSYTATCIVTVTGDDVVETTKEDATETTKEDVIQTTEDDSITVIEFKDENLYNAVAKQLENVIVEKGNKTIKIKNVDLNNVTKIEARESDISDISGVEKFTNLKILDLRFNKISDISKVKELKGLQTLYIAGNLIEDLNDIKELENLVYLSIGENKLDLNDLKVIEQMIDSGKLSKLKGIWLFGLGINDINEINFLYKIKEQLTTIDLHGNSIYDIKFLTEFPNLTTLYIFDNKINDAETIKKLSKLSTFNISNQKVPMIVTNKNINAPAILKQAYEDFKTTQIETQNCSVSDNKETITIDDISKEASIKIVDGELRGTIISIKYDMTISNKKHIQAGASYILAIIIAIAGTMGIVMYKKNKSLKIK